MGFWSRALTALVVATQVLGAAAHGFLAVPKSRNAVHNSNYCSHCLSAGGPGVTYGGGRTWPNSRHGVCGDPATGPLDHEAGGKFASKRVTGTYNRGQTITLRVKITAPHGGRFSFGVCPVPDGASPAQERRAVTQKCIDSNRLTNVDNGSPYWWFGNRGSGEYTMTFKLPPNVACKRCVLQWHYETGNSCTIPGTPQQHVLSANMVSCKGSSAMEEFWNCADVAILGDGSRGPPPATKRQAGEEERDKVGGDTRENGSKPVNKREKGVKGEKGSKREKGSQTAQQAGPYADTLRQCTESCESWPSQKGFCRAQCRSAYGMREGFANPAAENTIVPVVALISMATVVVVPLAWAMAVGTATLVFIASQRSTMRPAPLLSQPVTHALTPSLLQRLAEHITWPPPGSFKPVLNTPATLKPALKRRPAATNIFPAYHT